MFTDFNPNEGSNDDNGALGADMPDEGNGPFPWSDDEDEIDPKEFLINYNEKFKDEAPILFRDEVIQQTLSCLIGRFKPNALLIGAAGVGKTKIAEDIARRIAVGDTLIPGKLSDCTVWELPLMNIVSGSNLVGDVERKTKAILKYAADPDNKVILFIDEIHMLVGESQTYDKIAQIMKPALARGDVRIIGATTLQEAQNLMNDPAFNRRFTRVIVDELSREQTKVVLNNMQSLMFEHYEKKVAINDKIIDEIIHVADEYRTIGSHRPDNAITLLDRCMADARIRRQVLEEQAKSDPAIAAALQSMPVMNLSVSQMKETAMKLMTGTNEKTTPDFGKLRDNLKVIKGQDKVIDFLLDALERDSFGLDLGQDRKPLTLLFAGNSGVGKTEVAKIVSQEITGLKPIILNMTEYHSPASINRIIGAPAGYVGSDSKTELPFDILESNPYQVILLDEFEKADRSVQRLFMSAFDEGYIKTAKGKVVDFSRSVIIATTNAGYTGVPNKLGFAQSGDKEETKADISMLSKYFDTELLNRFTKILAFNAITEERFREILVDRYRRHTEKLKASRPAYSYIPDELSDEIADKMVKENYAKEFGARPVARIVERHLGDVIMAAKTGRTVGLAEPPSQQVPDDE